MKVYEISADSDRYQFASYDDKNYDVDGLCFAGIPQTGKFTPPKKTFIVNPMAETSAFTYLDGIDCFAIWGDYISFVKKFIDPIAELIPIQVDKKVMFVVNVLSLVECLDYKKSVLISPDGYTKNIENAIDIEKYAFDPKKIGKNSMFRLKAGPIYPISIYCYEGVKARKEDEFKYFVEKNNLKGLEFKCIWDSEKE